MAKHIKRKYYTCDLCGKEIENKSWLSYPGNNAFRYRLTIYATFDNAKAGKYDICSKCYERMREYISKNLEERK